MYPPSAGIAAVVDGVAVLAVVVTTGDAVGVAGGVDNDVARDPPRPRTVTSVGAASCDALVGADRFTFTTGPCVATVTVLVPLRALVLDVLPPPPQHPATPSDTTENHESHDDVRRMRASTQRDR